MQIKLTFLGAAQNVTGSRYLVEANNIRLLVDCGLYQERDLRGRNWDLSSTHPESLDAVLLTHAHLDHCGLIPKLVREGFNGPVYCTAATAEIAEIILLDAAKLQEEDAEFKRKRHLREHRKGPYPEVPLYTMDDARASFRLFAPVEYKETVVIGDGVEATFHDAGHVLGSSIVRLRIRQNGEERIILFSGDVGRWGKPILNDPTLFEKADYILIESTYGDRQHQRSEDMENEIVRVVNRAVKAGGNILIPSFALERTQEILYHLNILLMEDRIPPLTVFVDSPMAVSITRVFEHHPNLFDREMTELVRQENSPFDFAGLKLISTVNESKAINYIKGTVIIIAGSGMCTGGRIKHHLFNNISRAKNTVLFVGFQAGGTLGRQIVDGAREVRINGQCLPVKAKVEQLSGFSAHADRDELLRWLSNLRKAPKRLFVTHGEPDMSRKFAALVKDRTGWEIALPEYQEEYILD